MTRWTYVLSRNLRDIDGRILLTNEVDVGHRQIFADERSTGVANLVVPLEAIAESVIEQSHASLVTEAIGADRTVRLSPAVLAGRAPVVELRKEIAGNQIARRKRINITTAILPRGCWKRG